MLKTEHEQFLDLIIDYYNRREDWMENNTKVAGVEYRRVLKKIQRHCKDMQDKVLAIQWERREENLKIYREKGYVPRKGKPKSK